MARPKNEEKEVFVVKQVIDDEMEIAKSNNQWKISDMELAIDMLEAERTEKNADWMSDIFLPEFASQMLTQSSIEANQYFQTRDFVEVYIEDEGDEVLTMADANKELINRTLNQTHLHHYQKFMRANINKNIGGEIYAMCGWERRTRQQNVPEVNVRRSQDIDVYGNPLVNLAMQEPALEQYEEMVEATIMDVDRFNYDVLDSRNVFTDNSYVYSLQEKQWVTIREEKTINELKSEALVKGYINLDKLGEVKPNIETDTSQETYNKDDNETKTQLKGDEKYDIYHRYGKFWAVVKAVDDFGNPTQANIGTDRNGKPMKDAQLIECIISIAISGSSRKMILFRPTPFIDSDGNPYRPLIRGICYIHPTKDHGLGDGKYARELQVAINDTFNISNDRVMLATLPTLKGKKYALEDNSTVYFEPGHTIELEDPNDLVEFVISDNIQGGLAQIAQLKASMSGVTSIFPPDLGGLPEKTSTTATAVAGAEANKSVRANYRSLTFEHTFLNPLYWMITQMTYQFATEETAFKLMGQKALAFDPTKNFTYKPLSQSIETEYSKANQIREINTMMQTLAPTVGINPKAPIVINGLMARVFLLFGDEYADFAKQLLDEDAPVEGQNVEQGGQPTQNQTGLPQGVTEQAVRQ